MNENPLLQKVQQSVAAAQQASLARSQAFRDKTKADLEAARSIPAPEPLTRFESVTTRESDSFLSFPSRRDEEGSESSESTQLVIINQGGAPALAKAKLSSVAEFVMIPP